MEYTLGSANERRGLTELPKPAVLHIHDGEAPGGQVIAGSQADGRPLIGRDDVLRGSGRVRHVGAEVLQQRVGDSTVKVQALVEEGGVEVLRLKEVTDGLSQGVSASAVTVGEEVGEEAGAMSR